jgi:hypothetical protein
MTSDLRVVVEEGPKGKRWVAVAIDWPGLERNGRNEEQALEKLPTYLPRYAAVAARAGLGTELAAQTDVRVVERYVGTGSTDFWGISFAPSPLDRIAIDDAAFERLITLLEAAWAEFDAIIGRVSPDLRPGPRGGGRDRDLIARHVWATEGGDFSKRVKVPTPLAELLTPTGLAAHRARYVDAMRGWRAEGRPLGNWTLLYLLRHTAYHVLDHAWEMEDRDLTGASA